MAYKVKCMITGEYGTSDEFVKHGTRYFKNEEIYQEYKMQNEYWVKIINKFCMEYLDYSLTKKFPAYLPKQIKKLDFYDNETIYRTMLYSDDDIRYALDHKEFNGEYNKVSYIMAIIRNNIPKIWKQVMAERHEAKKKYQPIPSECYASLSEIQNPKQKVKDISKFLED